MAADKQEGRLKGRPATLDRWPGERTERHRALLLLAMQGPLDRSLRAVSRAMGVADGSIRNWRASHCWLQRIDGHGEEADAYALALYRSLYMADFGRLELPHVAGRVLQPLGSTALDDPAAQAAHDARVRVAAALPAASAEVEQATAQAVATHRRDERADAELHVRLVDGALGLIAKKLKDAEIRVSVRDIPVLLECRSRLVQVVSGAHEPATGGIVQSARVAYCKSMNGSPQALLEAMHEDAQELTSILGALVAAGTTDRQGLADAQDQVLREA